MKRKILIVAAAVIVAVVFVGLIADSARHIAGTRQARIEQTVSEIRRGSYFAWNQGRIWWNKLTETEKTTIIMLRVKN
jgi:archaellum component FlaG (FlaF/FlaG flagellin family)